MVRWHESCSIYRRRGAFRGPRGARRVRVREVNRLGDGIARRKTRVNALMQATLLSIAIALILALVAALVGPHFVDWNKYRGEFESERQPHDRAAGTHRRPDRGAAPAGAVADACSASTSVRPGDAGGLRARRLNVEFSLGALVRGEWKATDVRLDGAEIAINLDRNGRLDWPAPSIGFDPEIDLDRAPRYPRQPRALVRRRQWLGPAARPARVQGRAAHARGPGEGRRIVLHRQSALSVPRRRRPHRRRARARARQLGPHRPAAHLRCRRVRVDRERLPALRGHADGRAPGRRAPPVRRRRSSSPGGSVAGSRATARPR